MVYLVCMTKGFYRVRSLVLIFIYDILKLYKCSCDVYCTQVLLLRLGHVLQKRRHVFKSLITLAKGPGI